MPTALALKDRLWSVAGQLIAGVPEAQAYCSAMGSGQLDLAAEATGQFLARMPVLDLNERGELLYRLVEVEAKLACLVFLWPWRSAFMVPTGMELISAGLANEFTYAALGDETAYRAGLRMNPDNKWLQRLLCHALRCELENDLAWPITEESQKDAYRGRLLELEQLSARLMIDGPPAGWWQLVQ